MSVSVIPCKITFKIGLTAPLLLVGPIFIAPQYIRAASLALHDHLHFAILAKI